MGRSSHRTKILTSLRLYTLNSYHSTLFKWHYKSITYHCTAITKEGEVTSTCAKKEIVLLLI